MLPSVIYVANRDTDELALLFTGAPAPAVWKEHSAVQIVEEPDEQSDADSAHTPSAIPLTPPENSHGSPGSATLSLGDVESSLASLSFPSSPAVTKQTPPKAGAIHPILAQPLPLKEGTHPLFAIEQLGVDRRLIVNRKRQLKMYRVWMQGKFRKL